MNELPIKVNREILIYAFRYALGRQTAAPLTVVDVIKANIDQLSTFDLNLYVREIEECPCYGMEFDKTHWLNFAQFLKTEIQKRG